MRIMRELGRIADVQTSTEPIESVRLLSRFHGYNSAIDDFERLAEPFPRTGQLPDPQWGADPELGDQLPTQVNWKKLKEMQDARNTARDASADAAAARER
jgi:hypothetical protein